jgi:hypothetical protein
MIEGSFNLRLGQTRRTSPDSGDGGWSRQDRQSPEEALSVDTVTISSVRVDRVIVWTSVFASITQILLETDCNLIYAQGVKVSSKPEVRFSSGSGRSSSLRIKKPGGQYGWGGISRFEGRLSSLAAGCVSGHGINRQSRGLSSRPHLPSGSSDSDRVFSIQNSNKRPARNTAKSKPSHHLRHSSQCVTQCW